MTQYAGGPGLPTLGKTGPKIAKGCYAMEEISQPFYTGLNLYRNSWWTAAVPRIFLYKKMRDRTAATVRNSAGDAWISQ